MQDDRFVDDHHLKEIENDLVRYFEMPIDELERVYAVQFGFAISHFKDAIKLWRVVTMRKSCSDCHKIKNLHRDGEDASCPTCGKPHGSLSEVDSCTYSASTLANVIALLQLMVDTFTENFPVVFPSVIDEFTETIKRLSALGEGIHTE